MTDTLSGYERVVVTGASGWVGRNATHLLCAAFGDEVRARAILAGSTARTIATPLGTLELIAVPALLDLAQGGRTLLLHCGFPTQDQVEVMGEQSYVDAITRLRVTMRHVVEQLGAVDMVYISSGAATSVQHGEPVAHRTAVYGQAKIDDEVAYAETIASTGGRLCIIRAFALSGPYMTKPETYALGSLILQAQRSGAIEVVADRPVRRSYMAMDDMLRIAIHAVGDLGPGGTLRFETAGEVVEVGDLARRVLTVVGEDPTAITRPAIAADAPPNDYLGDPAVLRALAAAAGIVPASLDDQIAATAKWLLAGATS